jgi:ubiquinone/menaquinone biosynthesis C-methylase UbiE
MKLDLGCGQNKKQGFQGLDRIKMPGVDIICDLNKEKIPLQDNSVEEVFSMHFMEHIKDFLFVMEEIHRVCKNGAKVTIAVPYFNSVGAFRDPTHQRFFTYETFDHFTDTKKVPSFYSESKFRIFKKIILFYPANSNIYGKIRFSHMLPFQWFANIFPYFYEHSLLKLFAARDLYVELEVIKNEKNKS